MDFKVVRNIKTGFVCYFADGKRIGKQKYFNLIALCNVKGLSFCAARTEVKKGRIYNYSCRY